jgi:glutathione S-transferase/RNA polymerase-associated protein
MSVRLFEHPLSPYARKVKIVMYEKALDFETVFVSPAMPPETPVVCEWMQASPRREVPVLVDEGFAVFDSTVILEYLEERWQDLPMQPQTPAERARVRMLEEMCDGEVEAINWGLMEVLFFRRATGAKADEMMATAGRQLDRIFARLERELDGRQWMNGAFFGRGDAAVFPHINGAANFGFAVPDQYGRLQDWTARVAENASVQRDLADVTAWMEANLDADGGTTSLPKIRQYRDHRLEWMMKSGGVDVVLDGLRNRTIMFAAEFE